MDCIPPGSSVHGILQARILEWVAISFSGGSSQPRDQTQVSCICRQTLYQLSYEGSTKKNYIPILKINEVWRKDHKHEELINNDENVS